MACTQSRSAIEQPPGVLAVRAALLDGRNRNWAAQIAQRIDNGENVFVAVGAAHMAGEGGVPALLRDMGHAVERAQ